MPRIRSIDGLPVVDAKRSLKIRVTKADIAKAADSTKEPKRCAVARACYRELHCKEVRVHLSRTYVRTNDSNWVRYFTPVGMRAEIVAFDRGGQFEPGEFILQKPRVPSHEYRGKTNTKTGQKRPKKYHVLQNVRGGPMTQS
jgi:hypothetical protein